MVWDMTIASRHIINAPRAFVANHNKSIPPHTQQQHAQTWQQTKHVHSFTRMPQAALASSGITKHRNHDFTQEHRNRIATLFSPHCSRLLTCHLGIKKHKHQRTQQTCKDKQMGLREAAQKPTPRAHARIATTTHAASMGMAEAPSKWKRTLG